MTLMPRNMLVDIKTAIIRAFRAAFDDISYPDDEIRGISISMDYPLEQNQYPHLWVNFSFTKLQNAGIGHKILSTDPDGMAEIKHEWYFEGRVTLNIHALDSLERDIYASQLLQMLAFRELNPIAAKFDEYLQNDPNVYLTINRDSLDIQGQSTTVGTPWSDEELSYEDGYAFNLVGQVESTFHVTKEVLRQIIITAENTQGLADLNIDVDPMTSTPGEWI